MFSLCLHEFPRFLLFSSQLQKHWIESVNLDLVVKEYANVCVQSSRVCSLLTPSVPGISSLSTAAQIRIKWLLKMSE